MPDIVPPDPPSSDPGSQAGVPDKSGFVQRYRSLPSWGQIGIPLAVVAVIVGAALLLSNNSKSSTASAPTPETTTTAASANSQSHGVAVLAIVKQLGGDEVTATTEPATTEPATTEPATTEPATTEPATTEPATTEPATTEPDGPVVLPPGPLADSPMAFATAWNHSVTDTDVPALSEGPTPPPNWTQETIAGVTAYRANLGGNVWLVALAAAPADPIDQALLIWEPNVDSAQVAAQNKLYRDAFQALTKTVNESATDAQRLKLNVQLGLTSGNPPYPDDTQKTAHLAPRQYDLFNANPADPAEPGPATVISVITSPEG